MSSEQTEKQEQTCTTDVQPDRRTRCHLRVDDDFRHHPPDAARIAAHEAVRGFMGHLAHLLVDICPDCRERQLALTKLEESMMWANASIARHGVGVDAQG